MLVFHFFNFKNGIGFASILLDEDMISETGKTRSFQLKKKTMLKLLSMVLFQKFT